MKRAIIVLSSWMVLAGLGSPALAGEIRGQILITRTLTKKRVSVPTYYLRGIALAADAPSKEPVDEMGRTAVYLEGPAAIPPVPPPPVKRTLTQKNRRFDPEMMIVPAGSTVSFPNGDPIFHNVFSLSSASQFDLGNYPAGETRLVKLDKAGVVQVYCHLHSEMNAAIVVTPTGWYAKPTADGGFDFMDLPAGDYTVVAWHKSAGFFRKRIRVPEAGAVDVSMTIPIVGESAAQ